MISIINEMKRKTLILIVLIVVVGFVGFKLFNKKEIKYPETIRNETPIINVSLEELNTNCLDYALYTASNGFYKNNKDGSRLNIDNVYLGDKIDNYKVENEKLVEIDDVYIYPIIDNNEQRGEILIYIGENDILENSQLYAYFDTNIRSRKLDETINKNESFIYLTIEDSFYIVGKDGVIDQINSNDQHNQYLELAQSKLKDSYKTYKVGENRELNIKDIHIIENHLADKVLDKIDKKIIELSDKDSVGGRINSFTYIINKDLSISVIEDIDCLLYYVKSNHILRSSFIKAESDNNVDYELEEFNYENSLNISNYFKYTKSYVLLKDAYNKGSQLSLVFEKETIGYEDYIISKIAEKIRYYIEDPNAAYYEPRY